jgi:hypothetical protein
MSIAARVLLLLVLVTALDAGAAHILGNGDFAGLVDIGGGRKMYLECRGIGSPTVVLISGKGNGAADWSKVLDPAGPVRNAPLDAVSAGEGHELESEAAVFPAVSHFTRVCAYDRPGTRIEGTDISTPVAQPHRVDQDVDDLRRLLAAAGEPTMPPALDVSRIIELTRAIDALLLTWEPNPSLNEVIATQVQSLARAISATTDPGPTLSQVKKDLEDVVADILGRNVAGQYKPN